jgi:hypothetical protein
MFMARDVLDPCPAAEHQPLLFPSVGSTNGEQLICLVPEGSLTPEASGLNLHLSCSACSDIDCDTLNEERFDSYSIDMPLLITQCRVWRNHLTRLMAKGDISIVF